MHKNILAMDTSMDGCSVSLLKHNTILHNFKFCKKNHTSIILPMIQNSLNRLSVKINELDMIVFSKGPGQFTGIRISCCIAKTLTIGNKLKIIGISTLVSLAEQAWRKYKSQKVVIAIYAHQKKVYWAKYIRNVHGIWIGKNTESCITIQQANFKVYQLSEIWTLIGNAWEIINKKPHFFAKNIFFPHARDLLNIALSLKNKKSNLIQTISPKYFNHMK